MLHKKISTVTACIHYCVENSTKCSKVRQTNKRQESIKQLQEVSNKWILQSCRIQTRSIYKNQFYFYILAINIGKWNLKIYRLHKHDILKGKFHKICARSVPPKTTKHCWKKTKDVLRRNRDMPYLCKGRRNAGKIPMLPKLTYRLNAITIKDTRFC